MELNIEDVSQLTDQQLFATMKKCGLNVGPITGTTRSLYERKLRNFLDGKGNVTISAPPSSKNSNSAADGDENKPVAQKEPAAAALSKSAITVTKKPAVAETRHEQEPAAAMKAPSSIPVREKSKERSAKTQATISQMAAESRTSEVLRDTINRVSQHTEEIRISSSTVMTERPAPVYTKPAPVTNTFVRGHEEAIRQEKGIMSNQHQMLSSKPVQPSTTTLAYAASTITTTSMMPERNYVAPEKPKLPQPSFTSTTSSAFGADLGSAFTNPLRGYDSPSLFSRDKDRDVERFDNFLSGTKSSSGFATSTLRRNEPPVPTPVKDKFAERLNNYGLLKTDPNEQPILTGGSSMPAQTPLRSRAVNVNPEKTPIRNEQTYQTKQQATPAKVAARTEEKGKQAQASPVNFKYLIIAVVATIVVYLIAIQFQSNPVNPVEI